MRLNIKKNLWVIISLFIALAGVVAPITWDWWKSASEIELHQLSSSTLVNRDTDIDALEIFYKGVAIKQVTKLTFLLKNPGRIPIEDQHLKSPPTITFDKKTKILDFKIDKKSYPNLLINHELKPSLNSVILRFPLLNPEDYFQFSLIITGENIAYNANARITNIKKLVLINKDIEPKAVKGPVSWTVYLLGVVAFLFTFTAFDLSKKFLKMRKLRISISGNSVTIPEFNNIEQCLTFIYKHMYFMGKSDNQKIVNGLVNHFQSFRSDQLTDDQQALIKQTIVNYIENRKFVGSIIFFISVSAVCIFYIFKSIY